MALLRAIAGLVVSLAFFFIALRLILKTTTLSPAVEFSPITAGGALLCVVASVATYRWVSRAAALDAARRAEPLAPWRSRQDWKTGRIIHRLDTNLRLWWFVTAAWTILALIELSFSVPDTQSIMLFFALAPALWSVTAYLTYRHRRQGVSMFICRSVPFIVGQTISGTLVTGLPEKPPRGMLLRVTAQRGSSEVKAPNRDAFLGRSRAAEDRYDHTVFWDYERVAAPEDMEFRGTKLTVPIEIDLPMGVNPTEFRGLGIRWCLRVKATGTSYQAAFEIPVFDSATVRAARRSVPRNLRTDAQVAEDASAAAAEIDARRLENYRLPSYARINFTEDRSRIRFEFPSSLVTTVHADGIVIERHSREIRIDEKDLVTLHVVTHPFKPDLYQVRAVRTNGHEITVGSQIPERRAAEWIVYRTEGMLGRGRPGRAMSQ